MDEAAREDRPEDFIADGRRTVVILVLLLVPAAKLALALDPSARESAKGFMIAWGALGLLVLALAVAAKFVGHRIGKEAAGPKAQPFTRALFLSSLLVIGAAGIGFLATGSLVYGGITAPFTVVGGYGLYRFVTQPVGGHRE